MAKVCWGLSWRVGWAAEQPGVWTLANIPPIATRLAVSLVLACLASVRLLVRPPCCLDLALTEEIRCYDI